MEEDMAGRILKRKRAKDKKSEGDKKRKGEERRKS